MNEKSTLSHFYERKGRALLGTRVWTNSEDKLLYNFLESKDIQETVNLENAVAVVSSNCKEFIVVSEPGTHNADVASNVTEFISPVNGAWSNVTPPVSEKDDLVCFSGSPNQLWETVVHTSGNEGLSAQLLDRVDIFSKCRCIRSEWADGSVTGAILNGRKLYRLINTNDWSDIEYEIPFVYKFRSGNWPASINCEANVATFWTQISRKGNDCQLPQTINPSVAASGIYAHKNERAFSKNFRDPKKGDLKRTCCTHQQRGSALWVSE